MRITRITLFEVSLPLLHSFETSSHRKSGLRHILVRAVDDDGRTGWGEIASPTDPYYTSEITDTAWSVAERYITPAALGTEWDEPAALESTWSKVRGHEFTKAGFSAAAWDLHARAQERSLASVLGGTRTEVVAGVSLGIEPSIDELLTQVERQVSAGYPRIKLKIAPGWDAEPVRAVRSHYPDLDLHVDANGAYPDTAESAEILRALDEQSLTMIEQPYEPRDFPAHARLQRRIGTPVCLDESVVDLADLRTMIELDAGRVLNIKVSRMGGLLAARRAHDVARDAGIPVWCGGMHEFGVGRAANVAISSLPNFTLPSDVSGSAKYYARDVITSPVVAVNGVVAVPDGPGIGYDVDVEWVRQNTVRTADLTI
ncbi:o-succinylbenzoate synthase [Microbacterium sp. KUDC0406]|uniref:o-succinylbenzoate synthase n=1 Tax=Microbacterium sp. KUDC0406 TaxID=2909588 RepID=UPI001F39E353|nr:o-succinylbenzoate synthase [Microbacterium sp. KUDC0406]UJP09127.1 o-succinylbenzoate synthase [Microbacterium sp. KUDC0406]